MDILYDAVVIGAGIQGSSTAYNIADKEAKHVALLEQVRTDFNIGIVLTYMTFIQFQLGHSRGSSHGWSRITRRGYNTQYYAKMMTEAFKLWEQIEEESGTKLYT